MCQPNTHSDDYLVASIVFNFLAHHHIFKKLVEEYASSPKRPLVSRYVLIKSFKSGITFPALSSSSLEAMQAREITHCKLLTGHGPASVVAESCTAMGFVRLTRILSSAVPFFFKIGVVPPV